MEVIDDEGRLFGTVNIVDALVVLLVLAVVVAGVALVFPDAEEEEEEPTETIHATLDLGTQSAFILEEINEGDTYNASSDARLTITDVHLSPQGDGTHATVRVRLEGPTSEDGTGIQYDGAPPRLGRTLDIFTDRYNVSGQIRAVGSAAPLDRAQPTVVLRDTVAAADARELAVGDEIQVAGRTVATIEGRAVYATQNPDQHVVYLQTNISAHRQQGELRFGDQPVRRGQTLTLPGDDYTIDGTVESVGGGLERDQADVLLRDTIDIETADRLAEGDTAVVAGTTTATVENVELYGTNNPDRKRAFVGLSLSTVGHGERPRFGETPVQTGRSITFRNAEYTLSGNIERVDHLQQRGTETTRTVTIRMETVREEFASAIEAGMVERVDGEPVAEITAVDVEPSTVIVTGDRGNLSVYDHPYNRDVTITAELRVRETTTGTRFKGQPIRQRDTITLDLNSITVRGTVVRIRR